MLQKIMSVHPSARRLFEGRKIVVPSMHGTHHVMRPLLKQYLNLDVCIVPDLDPDEFGTFSREVGRPFDPVTILRKKILKGLEVSGATLGIGSEGSFSPHRFLPLVHVNHEAVMLIDLENDIEVSETVESTDTVYAQKEITCMKDMLEFTEKIGFLSHGIILKQFKDRGIVAMTKGILNWEHLYAVQLQYTFPGTQLVAETDMRGYMNPTRMKIIERVTRLLMEKIICICPECHWPDFRVVDIKNGLPCNRCSQPTELTLRKSYQCTNCRYTDERYYAEAQKADPQTCERCSP